MNVIREYTTPIPIHKRQQFLAGIITPGNDGIHHQFLGLPFEAPISHLYSAVEATAKGLFFEKFTVCHFRYSFTDETFVLHIFGTGDWEKESSILALLDKKIHHAEQTMHCEEPSH